MTAEGVLEVRPEAVVRQSGTSFYWAMRLLPKAKREAMYALYAFCRAVDDIADEPALLADKRAGLAAWQNDLNALYDGAAPDHPIACALAEPIAQFALPKAPFEEILRGMEMDAYGPIRAPDAATLALYCDRVAGAVGLQSVRIFGCRDRRADDYARATGRALQLTNILRDLAEDAATGRLYLSHESLSQAGIDSDDPAVVLDHPALGAACQAVAQIADQNYRDAAALRAEMSAGDAASLRPAAIMTGIYRSLFERMAGRGWDRVLEPVRIGTGAKLAIALRGLAFGR